MIRHRGLSALHFGPTAPGDATVTRSAAGELTLTRMLKITPTSTDAIGVQVTAQCQQAFKYEPTITAQQGAWVHGVKVEATRGANVMPATGTWFGAQFVLNCGSGAYDDLDKPAYVLQCVFKGSDCDPEGVSGDVHVGRFETQSAAKVSDIVHVLANSGCSIAGSLIYCATHVATPRGILVNVQSSATLDKGMEFQAGAGATLTSLLYATGAGTFVNFLEVAADGDGGVTMGTGMHRDPESHEEAGYLTIKVGAVSYQIPFYASS